MSEMEHAINSLADEQVGFIENELGLTKEDLLNLDADAFYDDVYDKLCIIEETETAEALDRENEELTERGRVAADIVTALGNELYAADDGDENVE